jgi:hypothetical protein
MSNHARLCPAGQTGRSARHEPLVQVQAENNAIAAGTARIGGPAKRSVRGLHQTCGRVAVRGVETVEACQVAL